MRNLIFENEGIRQFVFTKFVIFFRENPDVHIVLSPMLEAYMNCGESYDEFIVKYYIDLTDAIAEYANKITQIMEDREYLLYKQWVTVHINFCEDNMCRVNLETSFVDLIENSMIDKTVKKELTSCCVEFNEKIKEICNFIEDRIYTMTVKM